MSGFIGGGDGGAISFVTDSGTATESLGQINILGGDYIGTTGAGKTVTIDLTANAGIVAINGWNGSLIESSAVTVTAGGGVITLSVEKAGTGNLTAIFSDGFYNWVTAPDTVVLTAGADDAPQINYVYLLQSTKTLTASTVGWPATEFAAVATVLCQSAASLATDGAYKMHSWTDHVVAPSEQGHLSMINKWIRQQNATWTSGVGQTLTITPNGGSADNVIFTNASGKVYQLHAHTFPAFAGTPDVYTVNDPGVGASYNIVTDLNALLTDSTGGSMSGKYFSLVIWGVVSEATGDCKLMVNLPGGVYNNQAALLADSSKYANFSIPSDFKGTGFLIYQMNLRHSVAASGTWTSVSNIDLRGFFPSLAPGGSTAYATEFPDNVFRILDDGDSTKEIAFEASTIANATTRTITMCDQDLSLVSPSFPGSVTSATALTVTSGDAIITAGNLTLPATNAGMTEGVIEFNGTRYAHVFGTNNFFVGSGSGNGTMTTATNNLCLGRLSLAQLTTGDYNAAFGDAALWKVESGSYNVAFGGSALKFQETGSYNCAFGRSALATATSGAYNTAVGDQAANTLLTGSYNTCIGRLAGSEYTAAESSNIMIYNIGVATESNIIRIGTHGAGAGQQDTTYIAGDITGAASITATTSVKANTAGFILDGIAAGYASSEWYTKQASVQTGNDTATAIITLAVGDSEMISVKAYINGFRSTFADACGAEVFVTVYRSNGGDVALVGVPVINTTTTSTCDVTAEAHVGSQSVIISVIGVAAQTFNWVGSYSYMYTLSDS